MGNSTSQRGILPHISSAGATRIRGFLAIIRASHVPARAPRLAAHRAPPSNRRSIVASHLAGASSRCRQSGSCRPRSSAAGEAEPSREVVSPDKRLGRRRQCFQRNCADRTDARNTYQSSRCLILSRALSLTLSRALANSLVERGDLLFDCGIVREQQRIELDHDARQVIVGIPNSAASGPI